MLADACQSYERVVGCKAKTMGLAMLKIIRTLKNNFRDLDPWFLRYLVPEALKMCYPCSASHSGMCDQWILSKSSRIDAI